MCVESFGSMSKRPKLAGWGKLPICAHVDPASVLFQIPTPPYIA